MPTKPRRHVRPNVRPSQQPKLPPKEEFRNCDAPGGCPNIVSIRDKPRGYLGPVFCAVHREYSK